jgi:hypothetical protein
VSLRWSGGFNALVLILFISLRHLRRQTASEQMVCARGLRLRANELPTASLRSMEKSRCCFAMRHKRCSINSTSTVRNLLSRADHPWPLRAFFTNDLRLQFHEVDEDVSLPPQLIGDHWRPAFHRRHDGDANPATLQASISERESPSPATRRSDGGNRPAPSRRG